MTDPISPLADLFKALSHPVRLAILDLLAQGEASVSNLTDRVSQRQAYVSQQLMVLREVGLVRDRREGSTVFYLLADQRITRLLDEARMLQAPLEAKQPMPTTPPTPSYSYQNHAWIPEED
jgi:DNA-binding transcriptional ArsR family regulator